MTPNDDSARFGTSRAPDQSKAGDIVSQHAIHLNGALERLQGPILGCAFFFMFGGFLVILGIVRPLPTIQGWDFLIASVPVFGGGAACLFYVLRNVRREVSRVTLRNSGVEWEVEKRVHEKKWDDVREIYLKDIRSGSSAGPNVRLEAELKLVFAGGSFLIIDQRLKKYGALCKSVLSLSYRPLLDRIRQEFAVGKVAFGPLTLHPDGVEFRSEKKNWAELQQWTLHNGRLYIISTNPRSRFGWEIALYEIPNYQVLFKLLEEAWRSITPAEMSIPFGR
jgi:hypothetical protein